MARILGKLTLSALVLALCVGAAELAARALGLGRAPAVADYVADWSRQWQGEFYVLSGPNLSRDGLRDWDRPHEAPPGVVRVACLGDSVTHGFGVPFEDAWPTVLEARLRARGRAVEVLNVALPGWSTRQERIAWQLIASRYGPGRVLLGFCLNDVLEMQNNLRPPAGPLSALWRRSALLRALLRPAEAELARVEELFESPDAAPVRRGWEKCFEELRALRAEVRASGASLAVLAFPFRLQLEPGAPEPLPQRELEAFCRAEGIPYLDLLPALSKRGPRAFLDYDHLNREGAEAVVEALLESELLGP
jgi:lysophospholipase L1-like esterase